MRLAATVALACGATVAHAGTPVDRPEAIDVDRDDAPLGRVELGFDSGAPVDAWGLGARFEYLLRPITLSTTSAESHPVDHRETLALGGAIAINSIVVDLRMPLAHQIGDRYMGLGDDRPLDRWVPGDLVVGARLRVTQRPSFGAFLRAELTLPTGDDYDFAGNASWSGAWSLIGRFNLGAGIVLAATAGIRLRGAEVMVADRLVGDETFGGLGVIVPVPPIAHLWCKAEQLKATAEVVGVLGDNVDHELGASPVEARLGLVIAPLPGWVVGVRAGAGLDDQIGAPAFRATLELAWQPAPASAPAPALTTPGTITPVTLPDDDDAND